MKLYQLYECCVIEPRVVKPTWPEHTVPHIHRSTWNTDTKTKSIHSKVAKQLLNLKNLIGHKFKEGINKLHQPSNNSPAARCYGFPKIHKANIPFRPII